MLASPLPDTNMHALKNLSVVYMQPPFNYGFQLPFSTAPEKKHKQQQDETEE